MDIVNTCHHKEMDVARQISFWIIVLYVDLNGMKSRLQRVPDIYCFFLILPSCTSIVAFLHCSWW